VIKKKNTGGVYLFTAEITKIKEWLDSDLLMSATSVKIIVSNSSGIGKRIDAIALDEHGEQIAKLDVTDYEAW
jgi:uncharacterized transporter YbjL